MMTHPLPLRDLRPVPRAALLEVLPDADHTGALCLDYPAEHACVVIDLPKSFVGLLLGLALVRRRDQRKGILHNPGSCSLKKLAQVCSNIPTSQYGHVSEGALSGYKSRLLRRIRETLQEVSEQKRVTLSAPDPHLAVNEGWAKGYRLTVELEIYGIDLDDLLDDLIARGVL
jgi:hypothetical protein